VFPLQYANLNLKSTLFFPELRQHISSDTSTNSLECRVEILPSVDNFKQKKFYHHWLNEEGLNWLSFSKNENTFHISCKDILELKIEPSANKISCTPKHGVKENTIRHLILDTAIPFYLSLQKNTLVLHGSIARKNNTAVAFIGESGSGKSSIASHLSKNGWKVMSDDVVIIHKGLAYPSYPGIRLWPKMLDSFYPEVSASRVSDFNEKKRVPLEFTNSPCQISAIYCLEQVNSKPELFTKLISSSFILDIKNEKVIKNHFLMLSSLKDSLLIENFNYSRDKKGLELVLSKANSHCS